MSVAVMLRGTFAVLMIAVAAYHAGRLATAGLVRRRCRRQGTQPAGVEIDVHVTHAVMGVAMATMLLGSLTQDGARLLAFAFVGPALWFSWRAMRSYVFEDPRAVGSGARQALGCTAMLYMLALAASRVHAAKLAGATAISSPMPEMAMPRMGAAGGSLVLGRPVDVLLLLAMAAATVATCTSLSHAGRAGRRGPGNATGAPAPVLAASCQLAMNLSAVYMLMLAL